jgi:hypothetical protein
VAGHAKLSKGRCSLCMMGQFFGHEMQQINYRSFVSLRLCSFSSSYAHFSLDERYSKLDVGRLCLLDCVLAVVVTHFSFIIK